MPNDVVGRGKKRIAKRNENKVRKNENFAPPRCDAQPSDTS